MKKIEISTGVNLYIIEDERFKMNTAAVFIHRPLTNEDASKNAILPQILRRGSEKYRDFEAIEDALSELCGANISSSVAKKGEDHVIGFDCSCIKNKFAPSGEDLFGSCFEMMLEMIYRPYIKDGAFDAGYTEAEKKNLIQAIDGLVNDKMQYAVWKIYELMCEGEPYSIYELGTREGAEKIKADELYEYYKKVISESKTDIFICGSCDEADIISKIKNYVPDNPKRCAEYTKAEPKKANDSLKQVTEQFDTSQAKLSLGFCVGREITDDDYIYLILANSVLGSGVHSKLFNNVREKLSLAYYAFSRLERSKKIMIIGMGIEEKNYETAYKETMAQIDAVKRGEISDYEFDSAKAFLINNILSSKDSPTTMLASALNDLFFDVKDDEDARIKKISGATKEQIVAAISDIKLDTIYFLKGRENNEI